MRGKVTYRKVAMRKATWRCDAKRASAEDLKLEQWAQDRQRKDEAVDCIQEIEPGSMFDDLEYLP
jgi:Tfp pilus assembly major pilin PilA